MSLLNNFVESHRKYWISQLVDTSRRNPLLYLNTEKSDRLISPGDIHSKAISDILKGKSLRLSGVNVGLSREGLVLKLDKIIRKAEENLQERGLQTLYLCIGAVSWPAKDAGRNYFAPVILLPLKYSVEMGTQRKILLQWDSEAEINRSLQVVWQRELNLNIPEIDFWMSQDSTEEINIEDIITEHIPAFFQESGKKIEGFNWHSDCYIGNFSFQKMAMVQELETSAHILSSHPILQALCGDPAALNKLSKENTAEFDPNAIDALNPDDDFTFLPADSSQFSVIRNVLSGKSGVIQGPPGTGKSQTIANLIGELTARGKKVLFVAEKRAALEVVKARMQNAGLDDFILDLSGYETGRKQLQDQLRKAMRVLESRPVLTETTHTLWEAYKQKLLRHTTLFVNPISPWEISGREVLEFLAFQPVTDLPKIKIPLTVWKLIVPDKLENLRLQISKLLQLNQILYSPENIVWTKYTPANSDQAQKIIDLLEEIQLILPDLISEINVLYHSTGREVPDTLLVLNNDLKLFHQHTDLYSTVSLNFNPDKISILKILFSKYQQPGFKRIWAGWFHSEFKNAIQEIKTQIKGKPKLSISDIISIFNRIAEHQQRWGLSQQLPDTELDSKLINSIELKSTHLSEILNLIQKYSGADLHLLSFEDLLIEIKSCLNSEHIIFVRLQFLELQSEFEKTGLSKISDVLISEQTDSETAWLWFSRLRMNAILEYWRKKHPEFISFGHAEQSDLRKEFIRLDQQKAELAVQRIKRFQGINLLNVLNTFQDQEMSIKRQISRKRIKPLKQLFKEAPDVLLALFPVWMASPLSITQMMDVPEMCFDVVLFDEASQVRPEDAISSILRGRQLVVAGDSRQLPPSPFFASGESYLDTYQDLAGFGFESLLDMALTLPGQGNKSEGWFLNWHYRSRNEGLIAFVNREIYGNRMITFPAPVLKPVVHFIQVDPTPEASEQDSAEVIELVDFILKFARDFPEKSLGVISLGVLHAQKIEAVLLRELQQHPGLIHFFDPNKSEAFFIKNLERVQGDERDAIILSLGYGQDRTGTLSLNFGPLTQEKGERRLNVAITRARQNMWTFSSFAPEEIDLSRSKGEGMRLLKAWLEYSRLQGNPQLLNNAKESLQASFEEDVQQVLETAGYSVRKQYGASEYKIDMVVFHPDRPAEIIFGIECDGSSYQAAACVRDRVRLRQEHLEALGWNIYRIWCADWYYRRKAEISRLQDFCRQMSELQKIVSEIKLTEESPSEIILKIRRAKPKMPEYDNIQKYSNTQLALLLDWIKSDGMLRTESQLLDEMTQALGYSKTGSRIRLRLEAVISGQSGIQA